MRQQADWVRVTDGPVLPGTPFHAVIAVPILMILVMPRLWTAVVLLGVAVFMGYLHLRGRRFSWLVRYIKSRLRGRRLSARPVWYRRRMQRLSPIAAIHHNDEFK